MQPLAYLSIFTGTLLLIAGLSASTIGSVAKGAPDHANASSSSASSSSTTAIAAAVPPASSATAHGAWRSTQAKIAREKGWSLADWNAVIERESGGNPASRNASSGAYGIGQFLPMNRPAYPDAFSPNPVLQIKAMARYIASRYGTPTRALEHEHAFGWY